MKTEEITVQQTSFEEFAALFNQLNEENRRKALDRLVNLVCEDNPGVTIGENFSDSRRNI